MYAFAQDRKFWLVPNVCATFLNSSGDFVYQPF